MIKKLALYLSYIAISNLNTYSQILQDSLEQKLNNYPPSEFVNYLDLKKTNKQKNYNKKNSLESRVLHYTSTMHSRFNKKINNFLDKYEKSSFSSHQSIYHLALMLKYYSIHKSPKTIKKFIEKHKNVYHSPEALDKLRSILLSNPYLINNKRHLKKIFNMLKSKKSKPKRKNEKKNRKNTGRNKTK